MLILQGNKTIVLETEPNKELTINEIISRYINGLPLSEIFEKKPFIVLTTIMELNPMTISTSVAFVYLATSILVTILKILIILIVAKVLISFYFKKKLEYEIKRTIL